MSRCCDSLCSCVPKGYARKYYLVEHVNVCFPGFPQKKKRKQSKERALISQAEMQLEELKDTLPERGTGDANTTCVFLRGAFCS